MAKTNQTNGTPAASDAPPADDQKQTAQETELPGDSVCWLRLVCPECGTMAEAEPPTKCPQCGAQLEAGR